MNETSKLPFDPIPMPVLPALPEMPKPSFSRSTLPPTPQPRPMIVDDRPAPHPSWGMTADEFVPPAPVAAPDPSPPTELKSAGFPMSWLKPSRAKGVVLAGLGSLGIGAFGLNALVPMPAHDVPKAKGFGETAALPPEAKKPTPKITEERPKVDVPALLPTQTAPTFDALDPLPVPPLLQLAGGTEPVVVPPAVLPSGMPELPTGIPAVPAMKDPLPMPALPLELAFPALNPMAPKSPLPAVPLPGEGPLLLPKPDDKVNLPKPILEPKPFPIPVETLPPVDLKPPLGKPAEPTHLPPTALPKPDPIPMGLPPVNFTPPVGKPAEPTALPPAALPMGDPKGSIDLKTFKPLEPEPIPAMKPTPSPVEAPIPAPAAVEAKTDYDVDIHKLRAGDTYAAISEKFYGAANFANALRGYNDNADLTRQRDVQVPPMHIIKKFGGAGTLVGAPKVIPAGIFQEPTPGLVTPPKIEGAVEWGSPGARKPTTPPKPGDETVTWK